MALLLFAGAVIMFPAAASAIKRLPKHLAAMTPAQFEHRTAVLDDPFEPTIVISTEKAVNDRRTIADGLTQDVHLRALIDRETGVTRLVIWYNLAYWGAHKSIYQVHYRADGGLRKAEMLMIAHQSDNCPAVDAVGSCIRNKTLAFEVPETVLREVARDYVPLSRAPWTFQFKDSRGDDVMGGIAPAEASGLLRALDKWRSEARVSKAS
jgi:hypothetical protein